MDPKEALKQILAALSEAERCNSADAKADAIDGLRALADWLESGGFPPRVTYEPHYGAWIVNR